MTTNKKPIKKKKLAARCDRKRCMFDATVFPILIIPAPKWSHNPKAKIEMELGVNVCTRHAIEDVDVFIDKEGWKQLTENFAARRMVTPDRKQVTIEFRALEDRQFS